MSTVRARLESVLSRLDARAAEERVFTRISPDEDRAAADAADARRMVGISLGPLDGALAPTSPWTFACARAGMERPCAPLARIRRTPSEESPPAR
jgi:hypothetical protein